jgi:hypothetical protein
MIRSLIFVTILLNTCYSNTTNVKELQEQFNQDVIELNVFKKRFGSYLQEKCNDDIKCYKGMITRLKSWDTVQKDNKLKYSLSSKITKLKYDELYWQNLVTKLDTKNIDLHNSQFVSVIDLEKQLYIITFWDKQTQEFNFIGNDFISSGNINREKEVKFGESHYLKTPAGIFKSNYGWRSDGKINDDNVTLGYGQRDRYVFYFGKQKTIRYNTFDKSRQKIYDQNKWKLITDKLNFAVHAHKSSKPMGEPNSHGCIRMTDELNRFLDNNLILHKNILKEGKWLHKYAKEPSNPKYHKFAGEYLIVFDKI